MRGDEEVEVALAKDFFTAIKHGLSEREKMEEKKRKVEL